MSHSYPSDISREQFARILQGLESARLANVPGPRTVRLRTMFSPACSIL